MLRVSEDGSRRREGHAAGYRQLGRALLDLQAAADQVFDAISERAAMERDKLLAISRRIKAARAMIDTLSRSEEPLTVISPAQHPSSCTKQEDFKPLFCYKYGDTDSGLPVAKLVVNGGFNREFGLEGTLELFQFFSEENSGRPSKESGLKARDKLSQTKDDIPLESLFEKTSSFSAMDGSSLVSKSDPKKELQPPPPSLLPKHLTGKGFDLYIKPIWNSLRMAQKLLGNDIFKVFEEKV